MKILVTGGAGFIGSSIANYYYNLGHEVTVIDDLSLGVEKNLNRNIKLMRESVLSNTLNIPNVFDVDYIFHDAALSSSPMFKDREVWGLNTNVMGLTRVLSLAVQHHVKKVIFASSSSLYNGLKRPFSECLRVTPKTFYETSFRCREIIARSYWLEYGLSSTALRYFSVFGPNEWHKGEYANNISQFLWSIRKGLPPIIYGDGTQTRDFIYIDDVVRANDLAMKQKGKGFFIYNVGTGSETSFNEVVSILNTYLKTFVKPIYMEIPIKNYVWYTKANTTRAEKTLGFKAKFGIYDGIKELVNKSGTQN